MQKEKTIRNWPLIKSHIHEDHRIFSLRKDSARSPRNGNVYEFIVLETSPWVNIIPITAQQEVVLIRQYRHGVREVTLEIPGGLVEDGEPWADAAMREMREETGYETSKEDLFYLGRILPNPAIQNNLCHSYLARNVTPSGIQQMDEKEDIDIVLCPLREIPGLIKSGAISHSLVVVAFYRLFMEYDPTCL